MIQPERKYSATDSYRYGFNGKENDNEVKGVEGSQQDYGMRIYDPRIGKFLSVDPLQKNYPDLTPYQFANNRVIDGIDLDGLETAKRNVLTGEIVALGPINVTPDLLREWAKSGWFLYSPNTIRQKEAPPIYRPQIQPMVAEINNEQAKLRTAAALKISKPMPAQNASKVAQDHAQTDFEKQWSQDYTASIERNKIIANAMETPEGQGGMALAGTMYTTARLPLTAAEHAYGAYEGVKEGDFWKFSKNTALFALDIAPFLTEGMGAFSSELNPAHGLTQFERLKAALAQNEIFNAKAVGSALKADPLHRAGSYVVDDIAASGRFFTIKGGDGVYRNLTQMEGTVNGQKGIFEWIINEHNQLSHQRFIPGGKITGYPNQKVR